MSYPPVIADVTESSRRECEARDPQAAASVHPCNCCGRRIPRRALRWLMFDGIPHPVPVHQCPKYPIPSEA